MSDMTPQTPAPQPTPAGWYPDPENPGQQRYWDGSAWAAPGAPPTAPPVAPINAPQPSGTAPTTSTNAVIGLVLAILSWLVCPIIAAVVALVLAHNSDKEIAASGGRLTGTGMNKATRIISWINIVVSVLAGIAFAILAIVGVGMFAQVASSMDPAINTQTGLSDGEYVMDPRSSVVINDKCTFSGTVYTMDNASVKDTTVYGQGPAACGLGHLTDLVHIQVTGGTARIIEVR